MEMIADELKRGGIPEENINYFDLDSKDFNKITKADQLENLIQGVQGVEGTNTCLLMRFKMLRDLK